MAKVIISNAKRIMVAFSEMELKKYNFVEAYTISHYKRLFVNWSLPLMTWTSHDQRCVDDVLEALRLIGKWQGKLQDRQPRFNGHAHPPTILRDEGLRDQKIRFPVFAKQSAPYVQWERNEMYTGWMIHGYSFNDDLPSLGAYFSALTALKEAYTKMLR